MYQRIRYIPVGSGKGSHSEVFPDLAGIDPAGVDPATFRMQNERPTTPTPSPPKIIFYSEKCRYTQNTTVFVHFCDGPSMYTLNFNLIHIIPFIHTCVTHAVVTCANLYCLIELFYAPVSKALFHSWDSKVWMLPDSARPKCYLRVLRGSRTISRVSSWNILNNS